MVTFGQGYYPMLTDSNTWYVYNNFEGCFTNIVLTSGDTVISGTQYEILKSDCNNPFPIPYTTVDFLREDTLQQKVFFRYAFLETGAPDTVEYLFYDFNLMKGDSIFLYNPHILGGSSQNQTGADTLGWFRVDTTYLTSTIVGQRKAIHLRNVKSGYEWQDMTWVESIGAVEGIYLYGGGQAWLNCGFRNNTREWAHFPSDSNCICNSLGISILNKGEEISIFPNPVNTTINIKVEGRDLETVSIYNLEGQIVFQTINPSVETFDVGSLDKGFYFVELKLISNKVSRTVENGFARFLKF
jgi:hypothetical protein